MKLARSHRVLMGRAGSCFRPLKNVSEDVVRTAAFWDSSAYSAQHELLFRKYVCASPNLGAEPDTGYPMEIIFDIFVRYRSFVEADYEGVFVAFTRLYIGYMWIHLYPARDNITRMLWTPLLGTISHTYFTEHCHTKLVALAARPNNGNGIKETVWDDLYDTRNIIDNDPRKTAQIDGSPIYIHHPGSFRVAGSFIQGKYKGAHYSFQLLVTNMFRIADEHGLDIGVESDIGMAHRSGGVHQKVRLGKVAWRLRVQTFPRCHCSFGRTRSYSPPTALERCRGCCQQGNFKKEVHRGARNGVGQEPCQPPGCVSRDSTVAHRSVQSYGPHNRIYAAHWWARLPR